MGSLDSQHLQAGGLGWQDGAAANCSHLRHDQTVVRSELNIISLTSMEGKEQVI